MYCIDCESTKHPVTGRVTMCPSCKVLHKREQARLKKQRQRERKRQHKTIADSFSEIQSLDRRAPLFLARSKRCTQDQNTPLWCTGMRHDGRTRCVDHIPLCSYLYPDGSPCLDLVHKGNRASYCREHRTLLELEYGSVIETIMLALKRGYPSLDAAFPSVDDLANYIRMRSYIGSLGTFYDDLLWIPPPVDIAHKIDFALGGSLAMDNIFPLSSVANGARRRIHGKAWGDATALRNKAKMREQAASMWGANWLSVLADRVGKSRSALVTIRQSHNVWRDNLAAFHDNPAFLTMKVRDVYRTLGCNYTSDYWTLTTLTGWSTSSAVHQHLGGIDLSYFKYASLPPALSLRLSDELHTVEGATVETLQAIALYCSPAAIYQRAQHNPFL